jgi:ribose transport system ATP-binding protein
VTTNASAGNLLEVRGVTKTFGLTKALDHVDLDIRAGEVHALLGQNGSGKSTLIKILSGAHQPDAVDSASVRGVAFALGDTREANRLGLRFVHQDLGLIPNLDSVDNMGLSMGFERRGRLLVHWRRQAGLTRDALAKLGHDFDVRKPTQQLAPSERAAVAIARALAGNTSDLRLLVLDEPTASLSAGEAERVYALVRRVRDMGAAVLYVSHHTDEVLAVADRMTVLRDGRVVVAGRPTTGLSARDVVALIVGSELIREAESIPSQLAAGQPVLEVRALSGPVVQDLDLDVHAGEIVGIAGTTSSGRLEVGPLIFGGLGRHGTIRVNGAELKPNNPNRSVIAGVAYLPSDRLNLAMFRDLSVRENLTLARLSDFAKHGRLRHRHERAEVADWLDRLDIVPRLTEGRADVLSGGNQQRVMLARWLRLKPTVLVLDDPTQGVDVKATAHIHALLRSAAADGAAILLSSSDEDELATVCDRVIVLSYGRVRAHLRGDALSTERISHHALASASEAVA